jgi:hypothetical protein
MNLGNGVKERVGMEFEPKSILQQIECLARLTGASESFVGQVKALFTQKGISLDEDASPYLHALEEAFRREESIRSNSSRARKSLSGLQSNFNKIGQAYVKQIDQLRKMRSNLQGRRRKRGRLSIPPVSIQGDHRTYVTPPQRETMPMVPGPEEIQ